MIFLTNYGDEFKANVLDKGYVRMKKGWVMGYGDIEIVNDARVSFDKEVGELASRDYKLINYLANHKHTSCFRGTACKVEMYAPLMVARQLWKYIIGAHHNEHKIQDSFTNWNESSRRYITENTEFYLPAADQWRSIPENKKQGSGDCLPLDTGEKLTQDLLRIQNESIDNYENAMKMGVCPEQARLFLPAYGLYVRWRWTMSLQSLCHFISQRIKKDAQVEIQDYAEATYHIVKFFWENGLESLIEDEAKQLLIDGDFS